MASENGTEPRKGVKGLGSLEAQLMAALWESPAQLSVQEVCDRLGPDHNYKTVMTVLNRLVDKELLERELDGRAYKYRPRQTRDQFLESVAEEIVQGYVTAYGTNAAHHLSAAVGSAAPAERAVRQSQEPSVVPHDHNHAAPASGTYEPHTHAYLELPARLSPLVLLVGIAIALQIVLLVRMRR